MQSIFNWHEKINFLLAPFPGGQSSGSATKHHSLYAVIVQFVVSLGNSLMNMSNILLKCPARLPFIKQKHKPAMRSWLCLPSRMALYSIYFCHSSVFDLEHDVLVLFLFHSQLFIWQAHNALFMIRCLLKVFIREMSEEELHLQFSYQERAPGSCGGELPSQIDFGKERCVTGRLKWGHTLL